jgi:hypothetical protein
MSERNRTGPGAGLRMALGATLAGGLMAGAEAADSGDPFAVRDLPGGYMLAADTFVPTVPENKEDAEGSLCAGEIGSDRDKYIEEGRCAYTDPEEERRKRQQEESGDGSPEARG